MARSADADAREAKIAELKRLITDGTYETLEKLEEAVDSFLWSEYDQLQTEQSSSLRDLAQSHPR
ncbi:MAG: hypothetical protein DWQ37_21405 [Planctomycetota bacterium]|nr:MAG: hypothetical protein DWQ37_21405 [Planctomycetota bacterium]